MTLTLADHSSRCPRGVIENVLVRVGKFLIPGDFVVMDMEEDVDIPILLGRPFLHTAGAVFDTFRGRIVLNVLGEELEFDLKYKPKKAYEAMICDTIEHEVPCFEHACSIIEETSPCTKVEDYESKLEKVKQAPSKKLSKTRLASMIDKEEEVIERVSAKEKRKAWFIAMKKRVGLQKKSDKVNGGLIAREPG